MQAIRIGTIRRRWVRGIPRERYIHHSHQLVSASRVTYCSLQVSFEGTEFFYPGRPSSRVLQGLYVSVKPGQSVAFVGASGCGKSTCMQLLLRFYDPIAGFVSIDNRHIETVSLATLRAQIGIVSQEPALFDRTIADNIAYGDNARRITRADVMDAAKLANIHGFIESLPMVS